MTTPAPGALTGLATATQECWEDSSGSDVCQWVYERTDNEQLASLADWFVARPLTVLFIIVLAFVARWLVHRTVDRISKRAATGPLPGVITGGRTGAIFESSALGSERRKQRLETMASVLKSTSTGIIFTIASLMILSELGIDIAPLIASAGIVGVALGFGAQTLVKDFISGLFMILEDQYGVGDVVDLGEATGTVEAVGLRVTRLRSVDGTVWYARNGEVLRVGNMSQGWARAVMDVDVTYDSDIAAVQRVLLETAEAMAAEEEWRELVIDAPEVWGVEALGRDAVVVRLVVKTVPLKQWDVARELRVRIKASFDAAGIAIPSQRTVWLRDDEVPANERAEEPPAQG